MAKGIAYTKHLDLTQTKGVYERPVENWDFIYEVSTTKNPQYDIGDRVVLPDGREFRYAKSSGECKPGQGCKFTYSGYTAYTALGVSTAIGATEITIAAATHAALTQDELRGGYVVIYNDATSTGIFRGIVGNDVADANAAFVVYLDGKLAAACVAGTAATETFQNPYAALVTSNGAHPVSFAGVPAAYVSATGKYFFVQTKGPCWLAPQTSSVGAAGGIGCMFRHDGSLEAVVTALTATVPAGDNTQYAGFVLEGSQATNGPLFMLQG